MIRFVGGKPGGGKTLYAVSRAVVEELRCTNRFIVTNAAIEMDPWVDGGGVPRKGLERSMFDEYGEDCDCRRRIIILDDEQVRRFYAIRPWMEDNGEVHVETMPECDDHRFRIKTGGKYSGCCYLIDEAHEFFAARDWAKTGRELLSWASQQRRAGDDGWFVTQVIENVEKQLRGVSQECYWVTNHRMLRAAMFRQPDILTYKLYAKTPPGGNESYLAKSKFECKREFIYGIYNTAKGVGVAGRKADIGQRAKGLHWSWLGVFAIGLILGVVALRKGVEFGVGRVAHLPGVTVDTNSPAPPLSAGLAQKMVVTGPASVVLDKVVQAAPGVELAKVVDKSPWVVSAALSRESGAEWQAGALMMSDGTVRTGKRILEVINGYSVDGRFLSTVPTEGINRTLYKERPVELKGR